jgi:hypothetical protein
MSNTTAASIWQRVKLGRFVTLGVLVSFGAFLLFAWVSDFPPFESETGMERCAAIASGVLSWPVLAIARVLPEHGPEVLALSLFILPGVFWAVVVEALFIARDAHKA